MAIAGRVAIVPKGEYSNAVTYDKLDLVMFNNDAYIAKKASTGIEPTNDEYWMLILNNVVAEDLEKIIDGTTPVGNANKLGGKSASEYALDTDLVRLTGTEWLGTSILEKALSIEDGVTNYAIGGTYYTGNDLPNGNYLYSMATIFKRSSADISVVVWGYGNFLPIINNYSSGAWGGWNTIATTADLANYLPLNSTGVLKKLTETDLGGRIALEKPNTGNDFQANIAIDLYKNMLRFVETGGTVRGAFIDLAKCPPECKAELLHTGNKPSGSYTGNGSETERTIAIGGNGNGVLIFGSNGTTALVAEGAICGNGSSVSGVQHGQARLTTTKDITMKLVTNHPALNESGVIYYFAVL